MQQYVCEERNPLMQLVYLGLMHVNSAYYFYKVFPNIKYGVTLGWHHPVILIVSFIASQVGFALASFSDPGIVTKENVESFDVYPYNQAYSNTICTTCGTRKPARSKHCSYTGACVAKFDHYCPWINNAVGEYNYRYFHFFLISNCWLCFYGVFTIIMFLYQFVIENDLLNARFRSMNGEIVQGSFALIVQYMLTQYIWVFAQVFFGIAIGTMLFLFWGYHFYSLALANTTTSEAFKFQELDEDYELLESDISYFDTDIARYKKSKKYAHLSLHYRNLKAYVKAKKDKPVLYGFYSRGWRRNLADVIFPPSLYAESKFK